MLTGRTPKEALHSKAFYAIATAVLMGSFTYSAVLPQVTAHLTIEGVSVTVASLALSVLAIFGMLGKLAMGFLSERIGSRYALMVDLSGQSLFVLVMMWAGTPAIMWLSVPMFGFFLGGFGALFSIIVQDTFGIRHFGGIMGIINLATMVSFGVGPLLAGASFDLTGSYNAAFMTTAVLFAIGALALTQARVPSKDA
ncbi:MAG: MFS transporter [Chloroflexi bacterium]|nr:MFS transporter [Chloroflexota bacterium]